MTSRPGSHFSHEVAEGPADFHRDADEVGAEEEALLSSSFAHVAPASAVAVSSESSEPAGGAGRASFDTAACASADVEVAPVGRVTTRVEAGVPLASVGTTRADTPVASSDGAFPVSSCGGDASVSGDPTGAGEVEATPVVAFAGAYPEDGGIREKHRGGDDKGHHHHHHHRKHRTTGQKILRGVLIALLVVFVLLVLAVGVVALFLRQSISSGEQKVLEAAKPRTVSSSTQDAKSYVPTIDNTITYNGQTYAPNEKMATIAFIGNDEAQSGGNVGQADMVIVVAFNLETGGVTAISIPRDSMVDVSEYAGDIYVGQDTMQLCLAYGYGDGATSSSEHVAELVSRILYDVPVSYYFTLNLEGIDTINDSVGGVTLTPLSSIPNTDIVEGVEMTLWGSNATRYVRWRDTSELTSSLSRQDRQIQYLRAFVSQLANVVSSDPASLVNLYNTAVQYSTTNLGVDEFTYLASQMLANGIDSLTIVTLPGEMVQGTTYAEYYLDKAGVRQIVMDTFYHVVDDGATSTVDGETASESAYDDEVTESNTNIVSAPEAQVATDESGDVQDVAVAEDTVVSQEESGEPVATTEGEAVAEGDAVAQEEGTAEASVEAVSATPSEETAAQAAAEVAQAAADLMGA